MENLFEINNLHLEYTSTKKVSGKREKIFALNGVDLDVKKGEILAVAGESGCGKSTLARALMLLEKPSEGMILYKGENISDFHCDKLRDYRQNVQMVFQNPYSSLNPKMKIKDILAEPLIINTDYAAEKRNEIILEKINQVGLDESILEKYPHEFSGGQRQRIAIARALVLNPSCLIADEPVSALDVSIQAQIINLLKELREQLNLTVIFISHDLRVIKYIADRTAVMYLGEIVELAQTKELFENPYHPYTKALLNSIPTFDKKLEKSKLLMGDLPSPSEIIHGCKFFTRCDEKKDICLTDHPLMLEQSHEHFVRCWI